MAKASCPDISIVVPVYNMGEYVGECLDSLINQTHKNLEIICIDDGSTDNSATVLADYASRDPRIKIISQENQGLSCSRNNAMKIMTGKYMLCVDPDDLLDLNTCKKLLTKANRNNLDMLMFSGYNFVDNPNNRIYSSYWSFLWLPKLNGKKIFNYHDIRDFMTQLSVSSCLTMYNFDFIKRNNILFPDHLIYEDNVFFLKAMLNAERMAVDTYEYYKHRRHAAAITQNWDKHFSDFIKITDMVLTYLREIKIDQDIYEQYRSFYICSVKGRFHSFDKGTQLLYKNQAKQLLKKYDPEYIDRDLGYALGAYMLFPYYLWKRHHLRQKLKPHVDNA